MERSYQLVTGATGGPLAGTRSDYTGWVFEGAGRMGESNVGMGYEVILVPWRATRLNYLPIERRQERTKGEGEAGPLHSLEGTPVPSDVQPTPTFANNNLPAREDGNDTGMEHEDGQAAGASKSGKDVHPPTKKYRLTDKMKEVIWQLVCISNECCRIENEKKYVPWPLI